jgi:hypothetical protein
VTRPGIQDSICVSRTRTSNRKPEAESQKWEQGRRDNNASGQATSGGIIDPDRYGLAPKGEAKISSHEVHGADIPDYCSAESQTKDCHRILHRCRRSLSRAIHHQRGLEP